MIRKFANADITTFPSDAMIYSTNVRLALTGGVGAALIRRFGIGVQIGLQDQSLGSGRQMADVGDVFETHIANAPWRIIFHTVATDESYHTDAAAVRSILQRCLRRCCQLGDIRSVACSALGSGYGDLDLPGFLLVADDVLRGFENSSIGTFTIVSQDLAEFECLCHAGGQEGRCWTTG